MTGAKGQGLRHTSAGAPEGGDYQTGTHSSVPRAGLRGLVPRKQSASMQTPQHGAPAQAEGGISVTGTHRATGESPRKGWDESKPKVHTQLQVQQVQGGEGRQPETTRALAWSKGSFQSALPS